MIFNILQSRRRQDAMSEMSKDEQLTLGESFIQYILILLVLPVVD